MRYTPRPGARDDVVVACSNLGPIKTIDAFLSPLDAWLSASYMLTPGKPYQVMWASSFDPREFVRDHNGNLHVSIHLGWGARDGKLLTKSNGSLVAYGLPQSSEVAPADANQIDFVFDDEGTETLDKVLELCGLGNYQETLHAMRGWTKKRIDQIGAIAVDKMGITEMEGDDGATHLAVFDPEAEQWHFIALADIKE